jgi:hypothetical protein
MFKQKYIKIMLVVLIISCLFCSFCPQYAANEKIDASDIDLAKRLYLNINIRQKLHMINENNFDGSGWPQLFDNGIEDSASGVAIDSQGNIIVAGYTGYTENSTDILDLLTVKYDSQGNELWNVTFDSGTYDFSWGVAIDSLDNIYAFGFNLTEIDDMQDLDLYLRVVKYDPQGSEQWHVEYHHENDTFPGGITVDPNDCIIINGGCGDLDGTEFHCWTIKMNDEGEELWNKSYTDDLFSVGSDVAIDSDGNIIVGGMSLSFFGQGYLIIKYDDNGNQIYKHRFLNFNMGNPPNAIAVDSNDNVILTGQIYSSDTDSSSWHSLKSDKNGNLKWERTFDSGSHDIPNDVSVDSVGNVVTVGGSLFSTENNYEHLVIIYDKNGNEICLKRSGIKGYINGVTINENNRVLITGSILNYNNMDFYTDIYDDIVPPAVDMIKPQEKSLYLLGIKLLSLPRNTFIIGRLPILVEAENQSDVSKVEFYINNELIETKTEPPYEWVWDDRLFGRYDIRTMTYDESGSVIKYEIMVYKFF